MPGMPEAIFLEDIVVRDTSFDTLEKIIDSRGGNRSWKCIVTNWCRLSVPSLERAVIKIKPTRDHGRCNLMKPREEGVDFLNLDDGKLLILKTSCINREGNEILILRFHGYAVHSIGNSYFSETCMEWRRRCRTDRRRGFKKELKGAGVHHNHHFEW